MKIRVLVGLAVGLAVAVPAQAKAGSFTGVVAAKQPQRGSFVLVRPGGAGLTVHGMLGRVLPGLRVRVAGVRLGDGSVRASQVLDRGRVHRVAVRGIVVRSLARETLLATGRSVLVVHRSGRRLAAVADGRFGAGDVARFVVGFDDDDLVEVAPPVQLGQATTVRVEGTVVSLQPFGVSVEGLPVTITVPTGLTLSTTIAVGDRVELALHVGSGNVFTLAAIDENEDQAEENEVEARGVVVSSSVAQLVVASGGATVTFTATAGTTLPVLAAGTLVEARGFAHDGVITLQRLRVEDDGDGGDDGGGDSHGGGHDGGGGGGD